MTKWKTHPELITIIITILSSELAPIFIQNMKFQDPWVQQVILVLPKVVLVEFSETSYS